MNYWILMGDVVKSSDSDQIQLQQCFAELISEINNVFFNSLSSPLTITLGDEFQGIINSKTAVAEIVIAIEELKWKQDFPILFRFSVHYGEIETEINPMIAHGMLGQELSFARHQLEEMKKGDDRLKVSGKISNKSEMELSLNLVLELQKSWKWRDRRIISSYFQSQDYKITAGELKKDVSLMWRRFKSLAFESYEKRKKLTLLIYGSSN